MDGRHVPGKILDSSSGNSARIKSITDRRVLAFVGSTEAEYSSTELNLGDFLSFRLPLVGRFFLERAPKAGPDTAAERRSLSKCSARRTERLLQCRESESRVRTVLSFKFVSVKRSRRTGDRRRPVTSTFVIRHSSFSSEEPPMSNVAHESPTKSSAQ